MTGTIFTDLRDKNIGKNIAVHEDMTIEKAYDYLTMGEWNLWLFWFLWVAATGGVVYGFYYLENKWLY